MNRRSFLQHLLATTAMPYLPPTPTTPARSGVFVAEYTRNTVGDLTAALGSNFTIEQWFIPRGNELVLSSHSFIVIGGERHA